MSKFAFSFSMEDVFPKGITDENLASEMVKAGQEAMKGAIYGGALRHKRTGSMANSIKCTAPKLNGKGDMVGRVQFTGKDKFGMLNSYKAIWAEYGTKNQPATPFLRPAIKSSESAISTAMNRVFDRRAAGGGSRP